MLNELSPRTEDSTSQLEVAIVMGGGGFCRSPRRSPVIRFWGYLLHCVKAFSDVVQNAEMASVSYYNAG